MPEFNSPIFSLTTTMFLFNCQKSGKEAYRMISDVPEQGTKGKLLKSFPCCTLLWLARSWVAAVLVA